MRPIRSLSAYVRVIMRLQDEPRLIEQSHQDEEERDGDELTRRRISRYCFADGVEVVGTCEMEYDAATADDERVCPPCDIEYRVTQTGGLDIRPPRKTFHNSCQLHFWMQAHHLEDDTP